MLVLLPSSQVCRTTSRNDLACALSFLKVFTGHIYTSVSAKYKPNSVDPKIRKKYIMETLIRLFLLSTPDLVTINEAVKRL